jgi:hypothetical protein
MTERGYALIRSVLFCDPCKQMGRTGPYGQHIEGLIRLDVKELNEAPGNSRVTSVWLCRDCLLALNLQIMDLLDVAS